MKIFQDEAIVLRKKPLKEKDELVFVLAKAHGKMRLVSYGSRDPKSRKAGVVEQFNTIAFEARQGKTALPVLQQAKLLSSRAYPMLEERESLDAFYRASEMVGLVDRYVHYDQNVQNVYKMLGGYLDHSRQEGAEMAYYIALLNALGFLPEWRQCFVCDVLLDLKQASVFCTEHRGFAHQACCQKYTDRTYGVLKPADSTLLKIMSYWQQQDVHQSLRVVVESPQVLGIRSLLEGIEIE